jgi:hypothetical protein
VRAFPASALPDDVIAAQKKDHLMRITVELPEDIAAHLAAKGENLSRAALEALALEEYRTQRLSTAQLRRLLGYQTRMQVHGFLKEHGVYLHYTAADLEHDRQVGDALPR